MTTVFAFLAPPRSDYRVQVYQEIQKGNSRFGWFKDVGGKNRMVKDVKKGDWIVHINIPSYGKCVAVQVLEPLALDEGLDMSEGQDFHKVFKVDLSTKVEFDRKDANVLPSVHLRQIRRIQRISAVEDFLKSLDNLKTHKHDDVPNCERSSLHLKEAVDEILPKITEAIQKMNKSKGLEEFMHCVFKNIPNVRSEKNGSGWKSDHGADLILTVDNPMGLVDLSTRMIVQIKSYQWDHNDTKAIDQIVEGMEVYGGDAGLLVTTANLTQKLADYIKEKSEETGKPIEVISGADLAKFVLKYAPDLLIG